MDAAEQLAESLRAIESPVLNLMGEVEAASIVGPRVDQLEQLVGGPVIVDADGGARWDRAACETVGLKRWRRGDPGTYWLSMAQAAEVLGVARQHAYKVPMPVWWAGDGPHRHRVVRRIDVEQAARARAFTAEMRAQKAGRGTTAPTRPSSART